MLFMGFLVSLMITPLKRIALAMLVGAAACLTPAHAFQVEWRDGEGNLIDISKAIPVTVGQTFYVWIKLFDYPATWQYFSEGPYYEFYAENAKIIGQGEEDVLIKFTKAGKASLFGDVFGTAFVADFGDDNENGPTLLQKASFSPTAVIGNDEEKPFWLSTQIEFDVRPSASVPDGGFAAGLLLASLVALGAIRRRIQ